MRQTYRGDLGCLQILSPRERAELGDRLIAGSHTAT